MSRFLLHPKATMTIVAGGCAALAIQVTGIVVALSSLNSIPSIAKYVAPITATLTAATVILGAIAGVCMALAGAGRSPVGSIDAPASSVEVTTPPDSTTTVTTTQTKGP